jgi:EpsI family protein
MNETRRRVMLAVMVLLAAVAFAPGLVGLWERWMLPDGYYGHGPLVPLVSAWLIWSDRARLAALPRSSSGAGLVLVGGSIWLLVLGLFEHVPEADGIALVGALGGATLVLFGRAVLKGILFPLAYLFFMIPLPRSVIGRLSFEMQMLATRFSAGALHALGVPAVTDGDVIHLERASVVVGDGCSGLRALMALFALSVFMGYVGRGRLRALVLLVATGPIAVLANAARILVLAGFAETGNRAAEAGPLHDATGLGVFAVAVGLLLAIQATIGREGAPEEPPRPSAPRPCPLWRVAVLLGLLGAGAAEALTLTFVARGERPATDVTRAVPQTLGPWVGRDQPLGPEVLPTLKTGDVLLRRFVRPGIAEPVDLCILHASGDIDRVFHPPEWCYGASGYDELERGATTLAINERTIPANRRVFGRGGTRTLVYYLYRLNGAEVASYLGFRWGSFLRRAEGFRESEASLIRISTPLEGGTAAAEARIAAFSAEALGPTLDRLP